MGELKGKTLRQKQSIEALITKESTVISNGIKSGGMKLTPTNAVGEIKRGCYGSFFSDLVATDQNTLEAAPNDPERSSPTIITIKEATISIRTELGT